MNTITAKQIKHLTLMTRRVGKNTIPKWGLMGQNDGTKTPQQRLQSVMSKLRHRAQSQPHSTHASKSIIPFAKFSISSQRQRKAERTMLSKGTVVVGRDTPANTDVTHLVKNGERLYFRDQTGKICRTPYNRKK